MSAPNRSLAPLLFAALGLSACTKADHIEFDQNAVTLKRRGDEVWLHAKFLDRKGASFPKTAASWRSSNDKVATVANSPKPGTVTAVGPGHATITVKTDYGLEADVEVLVDTVEGLKVEPQKLEIQVPPEGEALEKVDLKVTALDAEGRPLRDRTPRVRCLDEKICNVDGAGGVWPVGAAGETTVEVDLDGKKVVVPVVAIAPPTKGARKR